MNLEVPVADYPLFVRSNIIPGLSVSLPLTLARNANNYLTIGISTSIFDQPTLSVTTLTASSDIKLGGNLKTNKTHETLLFKATTLFCMINSVLTYLDMTVPIII